MNDHNASFLAKLDSIIRERIEQPVPDSYVSRLLRDGTRRQAQKVGEEAVELALAAAAGDVQEQREEAADLLFHMLVLLNGGGSGLADIVTVLEQRHRDRAPVKGVPD
jgi:phosphoribosyl-ATP pyrophosphohydrolase/phosphoribosyl-AMP cyclohydrolase